jgi:bifunctional NMN adenylyltransferase/nudix hydrolase
MTKEFDFLIFIGRFQPLHNGHMTVIKQALERSERLIVLVGSAGAGRDPFKNPFTFEERKKMIMNSVEAELNSYVEVRNRLFVLPINDYTYADDLWIEAVQKTVTECILENIPGNRPNNTLHGLNDVKVGLIGHNKDNSSFYLKFFPQWENVNVEQTIVLSATDIRNKWFNNDFSLSNDLPTSVLAVINDFMTRHTDEYINLKAEYKHVTKYQKAWEATPYKPVFVTVDAVVIQSGHILLVRRKELPGAGKMALPGGFLMQDEFIFDGCIRELREETKLKVPTPALKGSVVAKEIFDEPRRSSRGRTVTIAYLFKLEPKKEDNFKLPKVKGSDDADKAFWLPLKDLKESEMFEDHYHIIRSMLGKL